MSCEFECYFEPNTTDDHSRRGREREAGRGRMTGHPLPSPLVPPSVPPSIGVFSHESALHIRWPKYWRFSFSISPCNEYLELISFRINWLDLLAVQGTVKSLLQHHSSNTPVSVWVCVNCLFSLRLRLPWLLLVQCFHCILDIWGLMV